MIFPPDLVRKKVKTRQTLNTARMYIAGTHKWRTYLKDSPVPVCHILEFLVTPVSIVPHLFGLPLGLLFQPHPTNTTNKCKWAATITQLPRHLFHLNYFNLMSHDFRKISQQE